MPAVPPPNSAIEELATALGEDSARELAEMFLTTFEGVLRDLNAGDHDQRKRAAHSLKSSSRIVGATALSARMSELETRLTHTTNKITPEDITATMAVFERIDVVLRAYARQTTASS
jgi:HPt (histidine-containing phosphotransfer) domain-containing protein